MAVRNAAAQADLKAIAHRLETPTGIKRLQRLFDLALPAKATTGT
jgi:hypothetical protein